MTDEYWRAKEFYWRGVNNARARQSWADYLSAYSWDAFFTHTSSSSTIRKHTISLLGQTKRCVTSVAFSEVSRCFMAAEEFKLGDWHTHGLVKWGNSTAVFDTGEQNLRLSQSLSRLGFSTLGEAVSVDAVANYLSKYVIKETPWEYDIFGNGWRK